MIIQTLQKLTDTGEQVYAKVCTVIRIDKETKCCDLAPVDGSAELFEVSFQPDVQGGGLCFFPAENSKVLAVFINKHHAHICNVSELDLVRLLIDKMEFSLDKDGLRFRNNELELLIDQEKLNFKKEDVNFLLDQSGINMKKGEVSFLLDQSGLNLTKGAMGFSVDADGMKLKKGGVAFSVEQGGFTLKTEAESLKKLMADLLDSIQNMKVLTAQGPAPLMPPDMIALKLIQTRFNNLLK